MRTFHYGKLIRDKILENMLKQGEEPQYRVLTESEFLAACRAKLLEEAGELDVTDRERLLDELADLAEVLDCLAAAIGKSAEDVRQKQAEKNRRHGSFARRIYVEQVAIPEGNSWIAYLEAHPDRYPEISG